MSGEKLNKGNPPNSGTSPISSADGGVNLIENLPVGVIIFGPDGHVMLCNPTAVTFSGLTCDEISANKARQIPFRFFHENGTPLPVEEYPFLKTLSTGESVENFIIGVDLDVENRQRWILAHTYPEYDRKDRMVRVVMILIDISKRKEIENKLKEEQTYGRSLMETLPDAIYFKDRNSRFIRINNAEANLLGVSDPSGALGKTDFDFFAETHASKAFNDEQEIQRTGQPMVAQEEKLILPDGRIEWMLSTKMPLVGPNGDVIGTFGISHNITRRKAMEDNLAESEQRFRTLFEGAAVGVAMMETKTGKFLRVNKRYCEMLGYTEKELMEISFLDLTMKEDVQDSQDHMELLVAGLTRDFTVEKRYIRKDSSILYAEVSVAPMWAPGEEPTRHITVAQDISKRKRAEESERATREFLQKLVDNANAPIITWDSDLRVTLFNHAIEDLTGFKSSEILGRPIEILFPEDTREKSLAKITRTVQGGQLASEELPILHQNGSVRLVVWNSSSILTDDGITVQVTIAIGQDITERFQVEQSLLRHTFELELAQRFSSILRTAQTVDDLMEVFVNKVIGYLSLSSGAVFLEDEHSKLLDLKCGQGWLFDLAPKHISKIDGAAGEVYASQKPLLMESFFPDPIGEIPDSSVALDPGGICIPLVTEGEMLGLAFLPAPSPDGFHEQEIRLIMILTDIVATAIKRTRLRIELEQSYEELKLIDARRQKIQDLLAREKEFLSITLMSIGDAIIRINQHGIIGLFNKNAEDITEYSATDALGKPLEQVFKLLDYDTNEPMKDTIERLFVLDKMEKSNPNYRVPTLVTRLGKRLLVSGTISPLLMSGEGTAGYVLAFHDVSEKYKIETQTALSQKMEAIGQLAAGIAHEINTPIQYIGDNINFLQRTFSRFSEILNSYHECLLNHVGKSVAAEEIAEMEKLFQEKKIQKYLSEVPAAIQESQDGIDRVRKIVVAIREFSHASDQEMKLADINRAILTTITISRNEWKYVADVETDLDPELPHVFCQVDEINQVVLNMIVNASQAIQSVLKNNPEEKGKIQISTRSDLSKVYISISDTGTGIPESIRERIFDPFFTTKDIGKGTGQGLSLAHNIIVTKHHGRIDVTSEPGKGTTFTIELQIENPGEAAL
ncbi:MAG: PAS domain S-box protein [Anaerolineaceae bacterium]